MESEDCKELYEKIQTKFVKASQRVLELENEVGTMYEDMESMERSFGSFTGKKKRDTFDATNEAIIGEVIDQLFRVYKFLPTNKLLGFTPEDAMSVCGRIKKVVVLGGRKFNKPLWKGRIIKTAVNKVVQLRTRYAKTVQGGYRGERVHATITLAKSMIC